MFRVRAVDSNQNGVHASLQRVVRKHLEHPFRRPVSPLQAEIEKRLSPLIETGQEWVLDGGCGLGESSLHWAKQFPQKRVLAVDKSLKRLEQGRALYQGEQLDDWCWQRDAVLYLRADLVDVWQIAQRRGWRFFQTCLLYPNPWPKAEHFKRRWQGHAIFAALLESTQRIVLRSNWDIYIQEFSEALALAGWRSHSAQIDVREPITAFERKYAQAGQALFELSAQAPQDEQAE